MIRIKVDTREQAPYLFREARVSRVALPEGDYALAGDPLGLVIERKSLEDLFGTVVRDEARFGRELLRLQRYYYPVVLVEARPNDIVRGARHSGASGISVLGHILRISLHYRVPVLFGGPRFESEALAWQLLKARHEVLHAKAARLA